MVTWRLWKRFWFGLMPLPILQGSGVVSSTMVGRGQRSVQSASWRGNTVPLMQVADSDKMATYLEQLRPLRKVIEDGIREVDSGTPTMLTAENMDFQSSLQVANASEHLICKHGDFALAKRFMKENPHHKGFEMAIG
jgi:hypothetical protein